MSPSDASNQRGNAEIHVIGPFPSAGVGPFNPATVGPFNPALIGPFNPALTTGRCDSLTGSNGAYNLFEEELRKDTIISQLNTIIDSLEQIKRNQYMLYNEVHAILKHTSEISTTLHSINIQTQVIAEISAINAYYNGITAANSSALLFYESIA